MNHERCKHPRRLADRLYHLGGAALLIFASANAQAVVQLSTFPPHPGVMPGGGWQFTQGSTFGNPVGPRAWVSGVYGGVPKVIATDTMMLAARGGGMAVVAAETVTLSEAGAAIARCLLGGGPLCAAVSAAAIVYTAYRVYNENGALMTDPGQAPVTTTGTAPAQLCLTSYGPVTTGGSPGNGCTGHIVGGLTAGIGLAVAYYNDSNPGSGQVYSVEGTAVITDPGNGGMTVTQGGTKTYTLNPGINPQPFSQSSTVSAFCSSGTISRLGQASYVCVGVPVTSCPASIDALNPEYSIPEGTSPGYDGKCQTGRYNHVPIAPGVAGQRMADNTAATTDAQRLQAVKDALESGQTIPGTISSSGPASQTGSPTTTSTTGPSGTETVVSTPTYNYNYAGDTINYNTTTVVVTTNNAGSTTTTTTTGGGGATTQDPADPCTANPNRVGCMELGAAPGDEVPKKTETIAYAAETVSLSSGCPAPYPLGNGTFFMFTEICLVATTVNPAVIGVAVFSALLMCVLCVRGAS